jgi:hypothetical protein
VFEQNAAAREKLMVSLLAAFDARTWVSISGIILRLVKGGGFGQARPWSSVPASCRLPHGVHASVTMPRLRLCTLRFSVFVLHAPAVISCTLPAHVQERNCISLRFAAASDSYRGLLAAVPLAAERRVPAERPNL